MEFKDNDGNVRMTLDASGPVTLSTDSPAMKLHIFSQPKPVGGWIMPGGTGTWVTKFMAYKKPNWLHRTMMRALLGWKWKDGE